VSDDWPIRHLLRLRHANPDDALRRIAATIRAGCLDPLFLKLIADHIDPDVKKTATGTKLVLKRSGGRKAPSAEPNRALRDFLELHIDIFKDHKAEAVKSEAALRFGVSLSTCKAELQAARESQKRFPDEFEQRREQAQFLRALDVLDDYRPLWPSKSD